MKPRHIRRTIALLTLISLAAISSGCQQVPIKNFRSPTAPSSAFEDPPKQRSESSEENLLLTPSESAKHRSQSRSPGSAQEANPTNPFYRGRAQKRWTFDIEAGVELEPDYAGSDDYEAEPDLGARFLFLDPWNNRHAISTFGWSSTFELTENTLLNLTVDFEEGRDESDNKALKGLDEIDETMEAELALAYRAGDFTFATVGQIDALGRGKGFVGFLYARYDKELIEDRLGFKADWDLSFGNNRYMNTEFGISRGEASRTSYAHYQPGGGWKSSTLGIEFEYFLKHGFSVVLGADVEYYFDKAADSPLIDDEGSRWGYESSIGLRYSF